MSYHVSIDIETLARDPRAKVLQVAAVAFDPEAGASQFESYERHNLPTFNVYVSLAGQEARTMEPATLAWWAEQPRKEPLLRACGDRSLNPLAAKLHLTEFLRPYGGGASPVASADLYLWFNHPEFDAAILADFYRGDGRSEGPPWHYRAPRDLKTFALGRRYIFPEEQAERDRLGLPKHDAYSDAVYQAYLVTLAWSR